MVRLTNRSMWIIPPRQYFVGSPTIGTIASISSPFWRVLPDASVRWNRIFLLMHHLRTSLYCGCYSSLDLKKSAAVDFRIHAANKPGTCEQNEHLSQRLVG